MWYAIVILLSMYQGLTHYNLNHHAAIRTGKTRCTSGIDKLRDKSTTQIVKGESELKKVENVRNEEHRHPHRSKIHEHARCRENDHTI